MNRGRKGTGTWLGEGNWDVAVRRELGRGPEKQRMGQGDMVRESGVWWLHSGRGKSWIMCPHARVFLPCFPRGGKRGGCLSAGCLSSPCKVVTWRWCTPGPGRQEVLLMPTGSEHVEGKGAL